MKAITMMSLPLLLLAAGCGNQPGKGDPQENPSEIPANHLVEADDAAGTAAGNGAMSGAPMGGSPVDQQPVGSTSSAPGVATSGPPGAGEGTGGADGGRTIGDQ